VAIDPRDGSVWGGSYGGGLLHILPDNTFQIFKQASPIGAAIGDPGSYRVSGLAFDHQNNLWIANYGAAPYLHVLKNDGTWQSFTSPFPLIENEVAQIVVDDLNQKWIVAPKGNGLILFNEGTSLATSRQAMSFVWLKTATVLYGWARRMVWALSRVYRKPLPDAAKPSYRLYRKAVPQVTCSKAKPCKVLRLMGPIKSGWALKTAPGC
jgi:hypothetical protein